MTQNRVQLSAYPLAICNGVALQRYFVTCLGESDQPHQQAGNRNRPFSSGVRFDEQRVQRETPFAVVEQRVARDALRKIVVERGEVVARQPADAGAVSERDEARLFRGSATDG